MYHSFLIHSSADGSPLDSKEIKPVNPKRNQPWIFIERTDAEGEVPIFWATWYEEMTHWGKDPDAGKDWSQEEKEETEGEMIGWHHQLNGHQFERTPGESGVLLSMGSQRVGHDLDTAQWIVFLIVSNL